MAMDVSTLSVRVESKGIDTTTKSLEGLEKRAGTTEAAVMSLMDKLGKSSASVLSVVQSMNQLRATMQGALPTNAISGAVSDFKKMADEIKNIQSMMGKGVGGNISITIKEMGNGSKEAVKGVESLNQSLASGQNIMQAFGKELYHIRNLLGGTMLAGALINTAQAAIGMADSWVLMKAKLNIALGSMDSAVNMQEKLFKVATSLHVPLEGVTQLFVRLVPAMKDYGYTTNDALQVTTAMSSALKVSGATAAEASSVMLQFSQSMQAGRLNGAEFNAVAEGAPIVLRAIAAETGKTRSELKQMGADGQLGIELITKAMVKWGPIWEQLVKDMPVTFEAAMGDLSTSMSRFIGITNESLGVTQTLSAGIEWLAKNLDTIAKIVGVGVVAAIAALTTSLAISAATAAADAFAMVSLAAAIGGTGVASAGAAVAVEVLTGALATLNINPIVLAVTVLVAAGAAIYAFATKTEKPLQAVYDNIDKINAAHPDSKGKFEAFTNEVAKLDKQITAGYKNYAALKEQQEKTFDPAEANKLTEQLKIQAKAIGDLEAAQKLYAQQIQNTGKIASDAHTKFMKENESQMQALGIEGNLKRRLTDSEKALLKTVKDLQEARALDPSSKRVQELNAEAIALGKRISEEKRVGDLIQENKAAKKSGESFEKKYQKETEGIQAFINKQNEELGLTRKLTEAEKESLKISEFISANRAKLSVSQLAALNVKRETILTNGLELKAQKDLLKVQTEAQDKYYKERSANLAASEATRVATEALQRKIDLQSMANAGITETALGEHLYAQAVNASALASIDRAIATEQEAKALEQKKLAMAASEGDQELAKKAIADLNARVEALQRQKDALEKLIPLQDKLTEKLIETSKKSMLDIGRSPGQILADGFGEAGAAINKMSAAYKAYADDRIKIDKYVADQVKAQQKFGPPDVAKIDKEVADKRLQISAGMYASMAGQAKVFFNEHSKGYAIMEKAEKAFRALELALAIKNFVQKMFFTNAEIAANETKSVSAIAGNALEIASNWALAQVKAVLAFVTQGSGDPYTAFGRMAAMAAILAAVGLSISGASGGGSKNVSQDRQAAQGAGTVFGDTTAKSESITKSLDLIKDNTKISSQYNAGMLAALQNIEAALTGAATAIIRQGVGPSSINTKNGIAAFGISPSSALGKTQTSFVEKLANIDQILKENFLPMLGGDALTKVFGLKTSVKDTGITSQSQTIADILAKGFSGLSYATIEEKARFRKTKQHDVTEILPEDTNKQFSLVIGSLATSIKESGKALGLDSQAFTDRLNTFVVDIGTISLEGMSSDKIKETLTNVFSKLGDQMATAALAGLDGFQKVGEGYFETLTRVASTVATVDGIFHQIGQTFSTTGLEAIKAKMNLVDLAGGLENLNSLVSGFFDKFYTESEKKSILVNNLNEEFKKLGITTLDLSKASARIDFRDTVNYFKEIDSEKYVALLKLVPDVDKVVEGFANNVDDSSKALENLAKQQELKDKLATLEGKGKEVEARKRQEELEAMDDTSKAIQLRIWELEDEKVAIEAAKAAKEAAKKDEISSLNQQISVQQDYVSSLKTSTDGINNLIGNIDSLASSGMAMLGMTPKVKSLVENFNSTDESIRSLSETLNKFTDTTVLSLSDRLTNLVEQDKAILDFQSNLKDMIGNLRFESLSLEDRISSLKTLEGKLFGEINGADNPLEVAKHLQEVITQRYSLEQEYQTGLLAGQKEINETTKSNLKQQIDSLRSTKDFLTSLKAFTASIKIGELSILSPEKQLGEASQQFYETLAKAKTGDTQAQADLTNLAKSLLDEAKGFYASTTGYVDVYNQVTSALGSFGDMANIDPQITLLEKQLSTLDTLAATTDSLKEQQIADLERVSDTLNNAHIDNKAKQQELIDALKVQISELKTVQENQIAQIKQQLAIRDESNIKLDEANGKLSSMRDSLKLLERK